MKGSYLVDTNVLVYAYDRSEPEKQEKALELLDELVLTNKGVLSVQVLGEFLVTVVRKLAKPLSAQEAYDRVVNYIESWPVLEITPQIVLEAARGVRNHNLSYWDAQVWATARLNQIANVLSEDFSHGSKIEGVRFLNPFLQGFALAR
jgi:predicted nucleic acid-binding protein